MSFSKQGSPTNLSTSTRGTSLNPNASEFVPSSLRVTSIVDAATKFPASGSSGKQVLDRSESSISTNSDEEARQYWQQQLPDDITPDFRVTGEDEPHGIGNLSLTGLSLHGSSETNRFSAALGTGYKMNEAVELTAHHTNGGAFSDKMGYPISMYGDDLSSTSYLHRTSKPWEMQLLSADHHLGNGRDGNFFDENTRRGNPNDAAVESAIIENNDMNPVDFLALQFPGFAAESLAEVYFANGCDLNLTVEMLTQLEVWLFLHLKGHISFMLLLLSLFLKHLLSSVNRVCFSLNVVTRVINLLLLYCSALSNETGIFQDKTCYKIMGLPLYL